MDSANGKGVYYGYIIVAAIFIFMAAAFGVNYNFGVFFDHIQAAFGWNRGTISGAYAMLTVVSGFLGILAGRLSDRRGPFIVAVSIALTLGIGYILMSTCRSLGAFYFYHGIILAAGVGAGWPGLLPQIGYYFTKNRGLMIGFASAGIGASSFFVAPLTRVVIENISWRTTYLIQGIVILVVLGAVSLVFKNATKYRLTAPQGQVGPPPGLFFHEALRHRDFYIFCMVFFLFGYNLHSVMIHVIPFTLDMGQTKHAVRILVFIGGISLITRIMAAWLSDHIGAKTTLLLELTLMLLAFVVLKFPFGIFQLYLFGAFFGLAYGGGMALVAIAAGDYFGKRSGGTILGGITSMYTVGGALGPVITGMLFDMHGNYNLAFSICLVLAALSLALCFKLGQPDFK